MRAAIYVRVSTQRQAQAQTIDQQVARLRAYVREHRWSLEPEHVFVDDGYSGAKLNRPGLDALRDRAVLVEFDVVLITEPDRLARNYVHQMLLIEELEKHGIGVEFLDRPMSDDPHDRLLLQIRGAVAEYERTLITDRMRRGRLTKYRAGKLLPWGRPPYGFQVNLARPRDPDGVRLDEAETAIVAQIFDWYLEPSVTLYHVARRLTALGVPTPAGLSRWNPSTVRNILTNSAYIGVAYAQRLQVVPSKRRLSPLRSVGKGESTVERPKEEWIAIPVPAVVAQDIFDQVQAKLSLNRQRAARNNTAHQYLLRGLVSCGMCRLGAHGRTLHNEKYHYYVCRGHTDALRTAPGQRCKSRYIPVGQLDELVWQDLCDVLTQPKIIAYELERAHGGRWAPQELQSRIDTLGQTESLLEHRQTRLLDAYLADVIDLDEFEDKRSELRRKQKALATQRLQLEMTVRERVELGSLAASIQGFCSSVRLTLEQASFEQRRQLVELLIDRVVVTNNQVEIRYAIPTQADGPHAPFCHLRTDYR